MVKKLSRGQKAWVTRKASQLKRNVTIATEIKIIKPDMQALKAAQESFNKIYTPAPVLTLCGQLEDAIMLLETRVSNAIAKINSLM